MRTTLDLDDAIMAQLILETRSRTKTAAVEEAIRHYLHRLALERLISASGTIPIEYDWKTERRRAAGEEARRLRGPARRR